MRNFLALTLICVTSLTFGQNEWQQKETDGYVIHYTSTDSGQADDMLRYLANGQKTVATFFGHPFSQKFDVYIFPNRAALDQQWQKDWGVPEFKSECWMVASGVGARLDILSPHVWPTEACEHQAEKVEAVQKLITHELVHVYHGQHNPKPSFDGLDDLAWLIEGVAVFASGQLDDKRIAQVKTNMESGKVPQHLNQFWTGQAKYGQAGSLMAHVDKTIGREKLYGLLSVTNQEAILKSLGKTEGELIEDWKKSLK